DVDAVLTERRTHRRRGVGLTRRDLELDLPHYLLSHVDLSVVRTASSARLPQSLHLLDLHEVEFDRSRPAEDRDEDPEATLLGVHLFDGPVEAREGAVHHADRIRRVELHLRLGLERSLADLRAEALDLFLADGG